MSDIDTTNNVQYLLSLYPWIGEMGISFNQIRDWAIEGLGAEAIVQEVRNTPQWAATFTGLRRADGTLSMNEAQYLNQRSEYKTIFRNAGFDIPDDPSAYQRLFENEVKPETLNQRTQMYVALQDAGKDEIDAFYVYAGMRVTTDDLFSAMVYGDTSILDEYNSTVASSSLDYETWLNRAAEVGLERVVEKLEDLQRWGAVTADAVSQVRNLDPTFAKQMMGVLYNGATDDDPLDLAALERAFEYSVIGGAATQAGLRLPDLDRVKAIRAAGIERAQVVQGYSQYALEQGRLSGMAQRAGASGFTQKDFEDAVFLQEADAVQLLERSQKLEESLAAPVGYAGHTRTDTGGIGQTGLRKRF